MGDDKSVPARSSVIYAFISRVLPRDSNLNAMRRVIHSRALLYLPRRHNVAVSHHSNVFSLFYDLLQPAQPPVDAALPPPHTSLKG